MGADDGITRRGLLATIGALLVAGGAGLTRLGQRATESAPVQRVLARLPRARAPLPAPPPDPAATTPGLSPLLTPTADFFRIDVADSIPTPALDTWRLTIDGMVRHPLTLTFDELIRREIVEIDATLACVSNPVGGPLVGTARWTGVRLDRLIAEAQPLPDADEVLGHSVDDFTAGFPVSALAAGDALVAIGMNGEVLAPEHGYPARIIVPGLFGYVSAVKWLQRIELTRFDQQVGYWVPRGWSRLGPMKLSSRIDAPRDGANVAAGPVTVAGVAWSSAHGIASVEVRVDGGAWQPAQLGPSLDATAWRQWWWSWTASRGSHQLEVRAIDEQGTVQSARLVPPVPNGAEGLHRIQVTVA